MAPARKTRGTSTVLKNLIRAHVLVSVVAVFGSGRSSAVERTKTNAQTQVSPTISPQISPNISPIVHQSVAPKMDSRADSQASANNYLNLKFSDPWEIKRRGIEIKYRFAKIAEYTGLNKVNINNPMELDWWLMERWQSPSAIFQTLSMVQRITTNRLNYFGILASSVVHGKQSILLYPDLKDVSTDQLIYQLELDSSNPDACRRLEVSLPELETTVDNVISDLKSSPPNMPKIRKEAIQCVKTFLADSQLAASAIKPTFEETAISNLRIEAERAKLKLEILKANQEICTLTDKVDLVARAVDAISEQQEPNFDDADEDKVFKVFQDAFGKGSTWFDDFKRRVMERSNGSTSLVDKAREEVLQYEHTFSFLLPTTGDARYFAVIKNGIPSYGYFAPTFPPIKLSDPVYPGTRRQMLLVPEGTQFKLHNPADMNPTTGKPYSEQGLLN